MKQASRFLLLTGCAVLLFFALGYAPPGNHTVYYQAELLDGAGLPVDTVVAMTFTIYDANVLGTNLWTETQPTVAVVSGIFSVYLGEVFTLSPSVFAGQDLRYLGIKVGSDAEMTPRSLIASVPSAMRAGIAEDVIDTSITESKLRGKSVTREKLNDKAVGRGQMGDTAVGRDQLGHKAVGRDKLEDKAVGRGQVGDTAVGRSQLGGKAVGRNELGDTAVGNAQIGNGAINSGKIQDGTIEFSDMGQNSASSGQVMKWNGSAWVASDDNVGAGDADWTFVGNVMYSAPLTGIARDGATLYGINDSTHVNLGVQSQTGTSGQDLRYVTVGGGRDNRAEGEGAVISGGNDNWASGERTTISGGAGNVAEAPYSMVGGGSENLAGGFASTVAAGQNNEAIGDSSFIGGGAMNHALGSAAFVGGGSFDTADGHASVVVGGKHNTAMSDYAFIGGGQDNSVSFTGPPSGYSVIVGGNMNMIYSQTSAVVGGERNVIQSPKSFIGGGVDNVIQGGDHATIGGGWGDTVSSPYGTIGGGKGNHASGYAATIGGGEASSASGSSSTVSGGFQNEANNDFATIGGGSSNLSKGSFSSIGGGELNSINPAGNWATLSGGYGNDGSAPYATIGGGTGNTANGYASTIAGGENNNVTGMYAAVGGGMSNNADGEYSFAIGYSANASHDNTFVWSSGNATSVSSGGPGQFVAEATRFWFGTGGGVSYTAGRLIETSTGAYLSTAGTWQSVSDADKKENFEDVNGETILEQIADLPITSWSYKQDPESNRHIGPTAQDFHATFSIGEDDKTISSLDPSGVALAGIKELYNQNQKLKAEVEQLRELIKQLLEQNRGGDDEEN